MNFDKKAAVVDEAAAEPYSRWASDACGQVWPSHASDNCVEACQTRNSGFEKDFSEARCHCRRSRSRARIFLLRLFALLAVAGLFTWHIVPKRFMPGTWDRLPYIESPSDALDGEIGHPICDDVVAFAETYEFGNLETFTLRNLIETTRHHDRFRNSFVRILPSHGQKEDILIDFSFKTSNPGLQKLLDIERTNDSLVINFPSRESNRQFGYENYIETQTKIYVRTGLKLKRFEIESRILGISIPSLIDLWVDDAILVSKTGRLEANPLFNARRTIIREDTGAVTGTFPLYDILDIETHTGAVMVDVIPRSANNADVQPAKFVTSSQTGAVHIGYKVEEELPERDYRISAKSDSGRITGWYVHGSFTRLESSNGAISATILPYAADRYASDLTTITRSGRQSITILPPYVDKIKPLARLGATHSAVSGAVDVQYPKSWEGTVKATTTTGAVSVNGPDLHIIRDEKGVVGRVVEAQKGDGEGISLCKSQSGSVKFSVDYL